MNDSWLQHFLEGLLHNFIMIQLYEKFQTRFEIVWSFTKQVVELDFIIQYKIKTFMRNIFNIINKDWFIKEGNFLELREDLKIRWT